MKAADRGYLRPGYRADMVLVSGDSTVKITDSPEVLAVARDGIVFSPADLRMESRKYTATVESAPVGRVFSLKAGS